MPKLPVYMDNHATTRVDPRVVESMLPWFTEHYGNPGSVSHVFGWQARDAVDEARKSMAAAIGAKHREIVFTSGATESNNLAIRGVVERRRRKGNHLITVSTEHPAVLDPLARLARGEYEVTQLHPAQDGADDAGLIDPQQIAEAIRDDTVLVTVMLANNEIGVIQSLAEIGEICHQRGVPLHTDATQAVGKIPVDVEDLNIDLLSFTAHKIYGPKGVGGLYVRRGGTGVRLTPLLEGGGQEGGLRSGTLNVPGIIGFARALELCFEDLEGEQRRMAELRQRLYDGLRDSVSGCELNGPALEQLALRLPGNLNMRFRGVDGEALLMSIQDLAVSSGSACTSANPEPSHVLRAIGLSEDATRSSLRFGLGRFNDMEEVDFAIGAVSEAVGRLRRLGSG
jgi:cysteine desulfurase